MRAILPSGAAALLLLAACRAGGLSGVAPTSALGNASFAISVPKAVPGAPAMKSLTVAIVTINGQATNSTVAATTMNLSSNARGCSAVPGGDLSCTAKLTAPAGRDSFLVTTYSQPDGRGAVLATSRVTTTIAAARSTTCVKKKRP